MEIVTPQIMKNRLKSLQKRCSRRKTSGIFKRETTPTFFMRQTTTKSHRFPLWMKKWKGLKTHPKNCLKPDFLHEPDQKPGVKSHHFSKQSRTLPKHRTWNNRAFSIRFVWENWALANPGLSSFSQNFPIETASIWGWNPTKKQAPQPQIKLLPSIRCILLQFFPQPWG